MISSIRNVMRGLHARTGRAPKTDAGFALIWVIGLGTVVVLSVSLIGAYALQSMTSSRRGQDFGSAIQAAQAGVDDFMARLNGGASFAAAAAAASTWRPVPGSSDAEGTLCAGATPPANCPQFRYGATRSGGLITVTATGRSRGLERAVQVTTRKLRFTDYLYFSDIEAADPADGFAYPPLVGGAPAGCGNPAWGPSPRPASGCKIPTWRNGDSTDGSRVHTDDVFEVIGRPSFHSRITASIDACASAPTACVRKTFDAGADPDYKTGRPAYADDLDMPASGLAAIAANAAVAGGCTYYGPTRIKFIGNKMRVWSPQTPNSAACGGGIPTDLLNKPINVLVSTLNQAGVCSVLLVGPLMCGVLHRLGSVVQLRLSTVLSNILLTGRGLRDAVNGLVAEGQLVDLPANGAVYVKDNEPAPADAIPDPTFVQCLLGSSHGMHSTVDTNLSTGMLNADNTIAANCRKAKLFVDGVLDGKATAGVAGDIVIMSDLTYRTDDNLDDDRLGLAASGPVEVYNSLQCTLAVGTCLSLEPLPATLVSSLTAIIGGSGSVASVLDLLPGYGDDVAVDASILSLRHRFGMQLPVLSVSLAASLLNQLVNLDIEPPTLRVKGSIAQRYRGIIGADLIKLAEGIPGLNLASADIDIGYSTQLTYDRGLRSDPPPFFPEPDATTTTYDRLTFAEVAAP